MYFHEYKNQEKGQVAYGVWQTIGNDQVWYQIEVVTLVDKYFKVPGWSHDDQKLFHSNAQAYVDPSLAHRFPQGPAQYIAGLRITASDFASLPDGQHYSWAWNPFVEIPPPHEFRRLTPEDRQVVPAIIHAGAMSSEADFVVECDPDVQHPADVNLELPLDLEEASQVPGLGDLPRLYRVRPEPKRAPSKRSLSPIVEAEKSESMDEQEESEAETILGDSTSTIVRAGMPLRTPSGDGGTTTDSDSETLPHRG